MNRTFNKTSHTWHWHHHVEADHWPPPGLTSNDVCVSGAWPRHHHKSSSHHHITTCISEHGEAGVREKHLINELMVWEIETFCQVIWKIREDFLTYCCTNIQGRYSCSQLEILRQFILIQVIHFLLPMSRCAPTRDLSGHYQSLRHHHYHHHRDGMGCTLSRNQ